MKISYLNRHVEIKLNYERDILQMAYLKDMHLQYLKNKQKLTELGISETDYIELMKKEIFTH